MTNLPEKASEHRRAAVPNEKAAGNFPRRLCFVLPGLFCPQKRPFFDFSNYHSQPL
jgi:hypothetical protein